MAHFELNTNGAIAINWCNLDCFTQGYVEALFFTESSHCVMAIDWPKDGDADGLDGEIPADIGFCELAPCAIASIMNDCAQFQLDNAALLEQAAESDGYDMVQAGRDYWFTRNGHGVGFWDRGLGEVGDSLSDASGRREVNPWFNPADGKVYTS